MISNEFTIFEIYLKSCWGRSNFVALKDMASLHKIWLWHLGQGSGEIWCSFCHPNPNSNINWHVISSGNLCQIPKKCPFRVSRAGVSGTDRWGARERSRDFHRGAGGGWRDDAVHAGRACAPGDGYRWTGSGGVGWMETEMLSRPDR